MLCKDCPSRDFCQSACPELELHLKELEGTQRELTIGQPRHGKLPIPKKSIKFTKRQQQIVTLLVAGKKYKEICQTLDISHGNVRIIVYRLRKKLSQ